MEIVRADKTEATPQNIQKNSYQTHQFFYTLVRVETEKTLFYKLLDTARKI